MGIVSCNWGGTSASTWIRRELLEKNPDISCYTAEFDAQVAAMDLERYKAVKAVVRPAMASQASQKMMAMMLKHTMRPGEFEKLMASQASQAAPAEMPAGAPDMSKLSMEDIMAVGPGDANEPGALYTNMVSEISGYSARGVIWYQGETDERHADIYDKLFGAMIACWRAAWQERNAAQKALPFLFVQIAPFGTWRGCTGDRFPTLRQHQALAAESVPDCYMASISDIGNVYDIHPKEKKLVGQRLALLAERYVYGKNVAADAPEGAAAARNGDTVTVTFRHGEGLHVKSGDFTTYNGFPTEEMEAQLLPPVLDGVNGLCVTADGVKLENAHCTARGNTLSITAPELAAAGSVEIAFAETMFYQVNLYNAAGLPAEPFCLTVQ